MPGALADEVHAQCRRSCIVWLKSGSCSSALPPQDSFTHLKMPALLHTQPGQCATGIRMHACTQCTQQENTVPNVVSGRTHWPRTRRVTFMGLPVHRRPARFKTSGQKQVLDYCRVRLRACVMTHACIACTHAKQIVCNTGGTHVHCWHTARVVRMHRTASDQHGRLRPLSEVGGMRVREWLHLPVRKVTHSSGKGVVHNSGALSSVLRL